MRRFLRNSARRLAFLALGTVVALLVAEGVVRLAGAGEKGTIGVLYRPSDTLGWEHRAHASTPHRTSEFETEWRLNNHGVRRDEDVEPETERVRLIVLGDSHAAGHGVEGSEAFAARLEASLEPSVPGGCEVLNFAVDGYSTGQQYLWVQRELARWRPDGLIVGVYLGNDLRENLDAGGLGGYERPLLDPRSLERKPSSRAEASASTDEGAGGGLASVKGFLSEHSKLYAFVGNQVRGGPVHETLAGWGLMREPVPDTTRRVVEHVHGAHGQLLWQLEGFEGKDGLRSTAVLLATRCLKRMQALCRKAEVEFLAVILPCRSEVEGGSEEVQEAASWLGIRGPVGERLAALRLDFLASLEQHEVRHFDPLPALRANFEARPEVPLYHAMDWHLDPEGHQRVAEQLLPLVRDWLR